MTTTTGSVHHGNSRMKESACDAGAIAAVVRELQREVRRRSTATSVWPANFALLRRPRLRCLEILM